MGNSTPSVEYPCGRETEMAKQSDLLTLWVHYESRGYDDKNRMFAASTLLLGASGGLFGGAVTCLTARPTQSLAASVLATLSQRLGQWVKPGLLLHVVHRLTRYGGGQVERPTTRHRAVGRAAETNCAGLADHAAEREAIRLLAREVKSAFR